jgi:hypothetical protein
MYVFLIHSALFLSLPACGERAGERGLAKTKEPPLPATQHEP